jgi:hypothetical protein
VVKIKQENGIWIYYMGLPSVHFQMVTVIGGNIRIITRKDMDHITRLVDRDTRGNSSRVRVTGMEYADTLVEKYIMGNKNRIRKMVMAIIGGQMEMNTTESSRMVHNGEMESRKRMTNYSKSSMRTTIK